MKATGLSQVIERRMIKHMRNYEQQAAFEQCMRFLAEMIEKYGDRIPKDDVEIRSKKTA